MRSKWGNAEALAAGKPGAVALYVGRSVMMVVVFVLALMVVVNSTYNPFIYFNF
jgi:hypothetical protein